MAADRALVDSLLGELPLERAMPDLVNPASGAHPLLLARIDAVPCSAELKAALLLYVDELDLSHAVSQSLSSSTGSYLHAIMHRREGDFSNSLYWLAKAGAHPFRASLPDLHPAAFVREVQLHHAQNPERLVSLQRREWKALCDWIVARVDC